MDLEFLLFILRRFHCKKFEKSKEKYSKLFQRFPLHYLALMEHVELLFRFQRVLFQHLTMVNCLMASEAFKFKVKLLNSSKAMPMRLNFPKAHKIR